MKRKSFLKSLLTILVAPKILGQINWANDYTKQRQNRWLENYKYAMGKDLSEMEKAIFKKQMIVNKEPPSGYAIGIDKYQYKWFEGQRISVYKKQTTV